MLHRKQTLAGAFLENNNLTWEMAHSNITFCTEFSEFVTLTMKLDSVTVCGSTSEETEPSDETWSIALGYVYFVLTAVMSTLSICGCIVIFVTYAAYEDLHTRGRRILVFLSIADMLTASGNLMGVIWSLQKDALPLAWCTAHSALTSFSSICSYLWNDCMALFLFVTLVRNRHSLARKLMWVFHICCWTIPGKNFNINPFRRPACFFLGGVKDHYLKPHVLWYGMESLVSLLISSLHLVCQTNFYI